MKLILVIAIFGSICFLLEASKRSKPKLTCTGTNGESYSIGEGYEVGCLKYECGQNGKLTVDIDPTCCLYNGNYYQVDQVVEEISYGENCVLEQMVCKPINGIADVPGSSTMSSEYAESYSAAKCMDDNINTYCYNKAGGDEKPFFMIEYNDTVRVFVTNGPFNSGTQVGSTFIGPATKGGQIIDFESKSGITGEYVIVKQERGIITFAEVQITLGQVGGHIVKETAHGKCNCEHDGKVVKEGENVTLSTGTKASCCSGLMVTPVNKNSTYPEVKLDGGMMPWMGYVYLNDVPVSDCGWDIYAATILCHDLGFGDAIEIPRRLKKTSIENSQLSNFSIKCDGREESIHQCKIMDGCNSGEVASVRCSRVKLKDDSQVFLDGFPLCNDGLKEKEITALCKELGFSTGILKMSELDYSSVSSKQISCSGTFLSACTTTECSKESQLAALNCSDEMDIQLLGGDGESEGNVYFRGGPVCDDDFDITDANVICREIGFAQAELYTSKSHYGLVELPFSLDNVNCTGTEEKLVQCNALSSKKSNCQSNEGAGVKCVVNKDPSHSRRKRSAAAIAQAAPAIMDSGSKIVGSVMNYFAEKEKQHQAYLKERPDKVDLSNDKISIKMKPSKGYMDVGGEFNQGGFELNIGNENPSKKESKNGGPAFSHVHGIGPMLMNGCFGTNYAVGDPCYASKKFSTTCSNMVESANYVGVGFDGTGEYTHASRKKSLIQRECTAKKTYQGEDVPDNMNIFGVYDTACTGKTFESVDSRSAYQRKQSDMGSNEDYLQYQGGSHSEASGSLGFGTGSISASHSSFGNKATQTKNKRNSKGSAEKKEETTRKMVFEFTCTLRRYNIFLDEVRPEQLSESFLEDYMSLPIRYYDFRQQAPLRYSRFLQRWGTHFIKSATFGGKFTLLRESILKASETKSEFQQRVQEDTTEMFGSKKSSMKAQASYSVWSASAQGSVSTSDEQTEQTQATSSNEENEQSSKEKQASKYSMDDIIVEGGHQRVASILADKNRAGFKGEFRDWLESIPQYPKGYDFKFGQLTELLNMNYRSLLKNEFEPCWKFLERYDLIDDRGDLVCEKCLYNVTVKNEDGDEVPEVRKCQFRDLDDFQDQMDRKLLSLKRAIDIYAKNGGRSTTEVTLPEGNNQCENFNKASYKIPYKKLLNGETYRLDFDLRENIGDQIDKAETMYISFKLDDDEDNGGEKMGRWAVDDSASNTFAGQYSKKMKADEAGNIVLVNGVQFSYESGKSGNYLMMSETDCEINKERIPSMLHQSCNETRDIHWINVPLATVHPMKIPNTFHPCYLEWSNANMLMSDSSCVRFTATSEGPIYFALAAIPNRPDAMYYLRISPFDVTIYKNSTLMNIKTKDMSAVGLGHKNIFQSYIVCSEHGKDKESQTKFTKLTYGKLEADETINRDASLNAYLIVEDDDSPIEPTFFAFGSGEDKVQIVDLELLDIPHINCRGDTILLNGQCVQACKISKIAQISGETVDIKCFEKDTDDEYKNATYVREGSQCEAICRDDEVAYPSRTTCKGDSSWTNGLNCHKQCDKNDTVITKGRLIINKKEEIMDLMELKMDCPNAVGPTGLIVKDVTCIISCGKDESGLKFNPQGKVTCSEDATWEVNSKKVDHICTSSPCSAIANVPNGTISCDDMGTAIQVASGAQQAAMVEYVSEGTKCALTSCDEKYKKGEPSTLICKNGEWRHGQTVETLQCIPTDKTCPASFPSVDHVTILTDSCENEKTNDGKYFGGTICNVTCKTGYRPSDDGSSIVQCISGNWVSKVTCINTCPPQFPTITNGYVDSSFCNDEDIADSGEYLHGSSCNVKCQWGYNLKYENSKTQCVSGEWTTTAVCIEKSCSNLPTVDHADEASVSCNKTSSGAYLPGTTCTVMCQRGYSLKDDTSIVQCIKGDWVNTDVCIGSVYFIAGGYGAKRDITLYDPSVSNIACSTPPPSLNKDWVYHSTFYHDNTIYLCGGYYSTASICISHSPGYGWKTHTLTTSRGWGLSTVVLQDKVYFIGGWDSRDYHIGAESTSLASLLTDTLVLTPVPNLDYKGTWQCTARIDQDTLVITGGFNNGVLSTVSNYNSRTSTFTQLPSLKQARAYHGCGVWEEGNNKWIIVAGGYNYDDKFLQTTEMMQLGGSQWTSIGNLRGERTYPSMAVTQRGVMVMGGRDSKFNDLSSVELLDWSTKTWSLVEPSLNIRRRAFGGAVEIPSSMFDCKEG